MHTCASHRYIDEAINLTSFPLIQPYFPNAKEITESFSVFNAIRRFLRSSLNFDFSSEEVAVVAVADGKLPRTAAMCAVRSRWTCYSVDPAQRIESSYSEIRRLISIPKRIEDVSIDPGNQKIAIILAVHSHANLTDSVRSVGRFDKVAAVSMPCCVPQTLNKLPDMVYADKGVFSEKNTIKIWFDAKE